MSQDLGRAKDLFLDALDAAPEERDAFLVAACAGDAALLARARALLAGHERASGRPELAGTPLVAAPGIDLASGDEVGDFRLVDVLGEGGFGTVWRAEQLRPLRRMVALKVVRLGLASAQILARFESERQVLARMDHPAIARVFDAGHAPGGRPFFAMELVRGEPIVRYAESRELPLAARLELFVEVCAALEHAHQKGVLHRDVKPSNVLVQETDGRARPKVIDFGIAKALEGELAHAATLTGHLIGTPSYASPEQARGAGDVDTRTDVYSLGALLYELLVGEPPLGSHQELAELGLEELLRRVREVDPPAPSRRAERLGRALAVPRELDWIVLSCLEKERERRYSSAAALGRDVERFLAGHPIEVAPPSTWYRTRKLLARHRFASAAALVALAALLAGGVGTTLGFLRARERAAESARQAETASHVAEFLLEDMILAARPSGAVTEGRDVRLVDAVAAAVERLDTAAAPGGRFERAPEVVARVRVALGESLLELGDAASALPELEEGLALARALPDAAGIDVARVEVRATDALFALARYGEAEARLDALLAGLADRPAHDAQVLSARQQRARAVRAQGRLDEAASELERALADAATGDAELAPRRNALEAALAIAYDALGRWDEAEALFRSVLADRETRLGPDDLSTLNARSNLGGFLRARSRSGEARPMLEETLDAYRRVLGPVHQTTLIAEFNLALLLADVRETDAARALLEGNFERTKTALGVDHPRALSAGAAYADVLQDAGELARAGELFADVHERSVRVLGEEHPQTLSRLKDLMGWHFASGDVERALALSERLLAIEERRFGAEHPSTVTTLINLATLSLAKGDAPAAGTWLARASDRTAALPKGHTMRLEVAMARQRAAMDTGDAQGRLDALLALREELQAHGEAARAELDTLAEEIAAVEASLALQSQ